MYSGPTQIVQKTRRGLSQKLEQVDMLRDLTRKPSKKGSKSHKTKPEPGPDKTSTDLSNNSPNVVSGLQMNQVPTFQSISPALKRTQLKSTQEQLSPQHEEMVKFVNDRWSIVEKEISQSSAQANPSPSLAQYYQEVELSPALRNFEPFDLENWWGKRLYHHLIKTSGNGNPASS
eukprot:TCALIF_11278-PA protein Name:"Similar to FAM195A Protein FAM195A (Bos taurus)" AED:0.39 eAED:0.39 QI:0/0.8/0.66/1/0.8/0.66/6/238/174